MIILNKSMQLKLNQITKTIKYYNYLPNHDVRNINKSERVRVVVNASAKFENTRLNDNILKGQDLETYRRTL